MIYYTVRFLFSPLSESTNYLPHNFSSTITSSPTVPALYTHLFLRIHEVLPPTCGVIIPTHEIAYNGQIIKFHAPSSPITQYTDGPPPFT
jgi:hypothetical protein